jgi:hypothetical protein
MLSIRTFTVCSRSHGAVLTVREASENHRGGVDEDQTESNVRHDLVPFLD